ncbi:MAG: crossover junction endodeoxyribonuclease RuvC [Alphaproteobacteria bacterium]
MLILGIDPGLNKTGWGVIRSEGHCLSFVASAIIRPDRELGLPERLAALHGGIIEVIKEWGPVCAAVEETFINKNAASALKLGQARGVVLCAPATLGLPVAEYSANHIKKSVVGAGHAAKEQMAMMVRTLLPASGQVSEDEADALAVAICHAHHAGSMVYSLRKQGSPDTTRRIPAYARGESRMRL